MRVDLCWFGPPPAFSWPHGELIVSGASVDDVAILMERQSRSEAEATLFWDASFGRPTDGVVQLLDARLDVAHLGLQLGTAGLPAAVDFITATWMWNTDAPAEISSTSWRLSLRCCLVRNEVIRQLGGIRREFRTLEGAGLELGHRYLTRGAFVRHEPRLGSASGATTPLPLVDEILFATLRYGAFWARWALGRGVMSGAYSVRDVPGALRSLSVRQDPSRSYQRQVSSAALPAHPTVTVIMPTIERYPYLRVLLPQLKAQTVPVHEIIIVDQTPVGQRDHDLVRDFPDLPIRVVYQDEPGQCSARNTALRLATGEYALFIDDDDEVEEDLVERHLRTLATFDVDVCCGVQEEVGAGPVPEYQRFLRASDVFPTNNTMIRRSVLRSSGMFDLAFDCKMCEDADLGTRLYRAGALMLLDPSISVLHHHAPRGGLRQHGARAITYASSRKRITHRNLPHLSEVYLGMRYYTPRQVKEMLVLRAMGTLRSKEGRVHQGLKAAYALAVMPDTIRKVRAAELAARDLFAAYPKIEPLPA